MVLEAGNGTSRPNLGNKTALFLFLVLLIAYVVQTQVAEYVQSDLDYRQPFFLFFLTHVSFVLVLPLHLLLLRVRFGIPISENLQSLQRTIVATYSRPSRISGEPGSTSVPYTRFGSLMFCLTLGVSAPSLLWYIAVSLTSISSVTALFNTNAFWTYLLSLALLHDPFRLGRLGAVVLASVGVVVDAYGGACNSPASDGPLGEKPLPTSPLLGNLIAFLASVASSIFQVAYKKYATTPVAVSPGPAYTAVPIEPDLPDETDPEENDPVPATLPSAHLPFALYASLITTMLGLGTMFIMWIPIPILNANGLEPFRLPPDLKTTLCILIISTCGVTYNTMFMILLGVWGPIVTSVGSLLTTILVLLVDVLLGGCVTVGSWVGCSLIAVAFAVLALDVAAER